MLSIPFKIMYNISEKIGTATLYEMTGGNVMGKRKRTWGYRILPVCVLLSVYIVLCAVVDPDRILPRTSAGGVPLGGKTEEEAVRMLEEEARSRREEAVLTVSFEGQEYPVDVRTALKYDCEAAVEEVLSPCRGMFLLRGGYFLKAVLMGRNLELIPAIDQDLLRKAVEDSDILEADSRMEPYYKEENGQLAITVGRTGQKVNGEKLLETVREAILSGNYGKVLPCPTVEAAAEPVNLERIHEEIYQETVNAALDPENGYEIIPSVTGVDFDMEYAKDVLEQAQEGDTVTIDLIHTEPEVSTEDMEEHLFQDVLAEFSTVVGGSENRKVNIRIAADRCREIILNTGDEFSFNQTVGEQTAETGFKKANATLDGKIIQAYGGGICQVSTTIFEAALYAGLDIPELWCHTYISIYADPGMDAAVAWDALDLRIVNDRNYPVLLEVTYEGGLLTATFWGTRTEDTSIDIETEVLYDSSDLMKVMTYRKTYSPDRSHFFMEKISYSEYLNPSKRVD